MTAKRKASITRRKKRKSWRGSSKTSKHKRNRSIPRVVPPPPPPPPPAASQQLFNEYMFKFKIS